MVAGYFVLPLATPAWDAPAGDQVRLFTAGPVPADRIDFASTNT
jgi:hypothetical protein